MIHKIWICSNCGTEYEAGITTAKSRCPKCNIINFGYKEIMEDEYINWLKRNVVIERYNLTCELPRS